MQGGEKNDAESLAEQRPFVEALARRLVLDPQAADDLVQDTLLAAMKSPPKQSVRGWLARVVRNLAYRTLRSEERRRRREHRAARPDRTPATGDLVARVTWQRKVAGVVLALDEPYRTTLLLRFYEDLQPKEIAERLGVPAATVRTRLKRGLERMRERLDAEHGGDRRAWCLALFPLAFASAPASAATAATSGAVVGVVVMSAKKKLMIAACVLLALVGTTWLGTRVLKRPEAPARAARVVPAEEPSGTRTEVLRPAQDQRDELWVLVKARTGKPLPGAAVEVRRRGRIVVSTESLRRRWLAMARAPRSPGSCLVADEGGRVALHGEAGEIVDLYVTHPGYGPVSRKAQIPPDSRARTPVVILLGPSRSLRGRVHDDDGRPVPGATVLAGGPGLPYSRGWGSWPFRTVADAEGHYEFAVLPGEDLSVWAGFAADAVQYAATLRFPGTERLDIRIERGGIIEGTVSLAGSGEPLAGVTVVAILSKVPQPDVASAVTDSSGRYRIDSLPPGFLSGVEAFKEGLVQSFDDGVRQSVRRGDLLRIDLTMHAGARVKGRVRGPQGPVARASVISWFTKPSGNPLQRSAVTDEEGRYELSGLPAGRHLLWVRAAGFVQPGMDENPFRQIQDTTSDADFVVTVETGEEIERDLRLVRAGGVVEGWVEGPNGKPFAGARVQVGGASATSGPDGRFRLDGVSVASFDDTVVVTAKGLRQVTPAPKLTRGVDRVENVRVRLTRIPTIRGLVADEDGNLVAGATVLVARGAHPGSSDPHKKSHLRRMWYQAERVPVDTQGHFQVELSSTWGTYVRAQAPGRATSAPQLVIPEQELKLVVGEAASLCGVVISTDGDPVAKAWIRVRRPGTYTQDWRLGRDFSPASSIAAISDPGGGFVIPQLARGRWELEVTAAGHVRNITTVDRDDNVRIQLAPTLSIRGTVVLANGTPVQGVHLYRWQIDEKGKTVAGQGSQYATLSGVDGRFVLGGLKQGLYRINILPGPKSNVVRTEFKPVKAGATGVRLQVEPGMSITGRLQTKEGVPLPYVSVTARGSDHDGYGTDQTDLKGRFEIHGLAPGDYALQFRKQDRQATAFDRFRVAAGTTELAVTWGEADEPDARALADQIRGVLVDERDRPVANAWIEIKDGVRRRGVRTDAQGRFTLTGVPAGRHRLFLSADGYVRDLDADLEAGTNDVLLVARRGLAIAGVVRDEGDRPLAGVDVSAIGPQGRGKTDTDAQGRFEVTGLVKGEYELRVGKLGYVLPKRRKVAAGTRDLVYVLRKGLSAAGWLKNADGSYLADTLVVFRHTDDPHQRAATRTDMEAAFVVQGLVPGRYEAFVIVDNRNRPCGTLEAGATNVELVVSE